LRWIEVERVMTDHVDSTAPSSRQLRCFAWLLTLMLAVFAWRWERHAPSLLLQGLAAGLFAVGTLWPRRLRWLHAGLTALASPVSWLASRVLLTAIYYGMITPLALVFRLAGRDVLQRHFDKSADTYWQPRLRPADSQGYYRLF
jgi:hypothetical protein